MNLHGENSGAEADPGFAFAPPPTNPTACNISGFLGAVGQCCSTPGPGT